MPHQRIFCGVGMQLAITTKAMVERAHASAYEDQAMSCCVDVVKPIEVVCEKLHEQHATSLPVVDKAGSCRGTVSVHPLAPA